MPTSSAYIHIPFCKQICSYCDFCKVYYNEELVFKYLDSLEQEINDNYQGEILKTLYIGGGTPSSLSYLELERLFRILDILKKDEDIEFTIECNFDSITKEKLDLFKKKGVNRLSFGVETTDLKCLKRLNRILDVNYVKEIISYAKKIGLTNINVDLIYALPFSNMEIVKKDLDFILGLDIKHISTYSLIIEQNTKFYIDKVKNIDEELDLEMYNYIRKRLKDNEYIHYEISNFAKEGYQSQHNLVYWHNEYYYGFGVGASSYLKKRRMTNTRSITKYIKKDYNPTIEELTRSDIIAYEMILALRLKRGISITSFKKKYGVYPSELFKYDDLIANKILVMDDDRLYVNEESWYVINNILERFIEVKDE